MLVKESRVTLVIDVELDAKGLNCPLPLLKAKQALNGMEGGQVLRVEATDAGSVRDFKAFCEVAGHKLIASEEVDGTFVHTVKKGAL
ncbi:sulfurtransferase TusA family protein [Aestuariirhabdus sp. Z084]|uniref:sulfurtransferase TusA family protein n=1 Tax=Aestuariirhabdus haliotis TaxID=2918751 RepID=UPI00201B44D4|nr:sulfurtransferase TusA family protein [Aestuariirhabdus haliotis]MCL6416331.1 sulfurtransferase TusA family protein [Aestuariirhabdus haliotis]MCL6420204.1 sulfurtransferase TusA family protein [Aestuariirhabdus haliotis]